MPAEPAVTLIAVHLYPKSARSEVEGEEADAAGKIWLKVRVTAPPEDGKANKAMLKLLAKHWGCPVSALSIVSGETSRYKQIRREASR